MTGESRRPLSILIAALGGQGGGVLTEWIVSAASHAGYPVQSTSIPGVAQRTGATTYYLEVHPETLEPGAPEPVFSLYPLAGDVDVIVASEMLEAARTVEMDYASPERTTLIASTHRLFTIAEKTVLGNGIVPHERLEAAARALARRYIGFDALALARSAGSEVNAVMLGALAGAEVIPLPDSAYEAAIRESGVAVERNLAGFKAGRELVLASPPADTAGPATMSWRETRASRAAELGSRGPAFLGLTERLETEFPEALHATLGEAVARLIDYQDVRYAEEFLSRVRRVRALDPGTRLTEVFARRLAVWMSYEDAIRVADLKSRRGRFERIRQEQGAHNGAALVVTDYLKPELDELYGILPAAVAGPVARWAERRWPESRPTLPQHVKTTHIFGFLRVWALGRLRFLRPSSLRRQREFAMIDGWQQCVLDCASLDSDLACQVAESAGAVKGYGAVRRRTAAGFARFLAEGVRPVVELARAEAQGYARVTEIIARSRERLLQDEQGIEAALALLGGR